MSNTKYGYPCAGNTLLPRAEGGNRGRLFGKIQDVNPGRPIVYPPELADIPPFADWLKERVEHAQRSGEHLDEDIKQYACPPERYATSHRQMYSFGMHLRVRSSEGGLVTRDSCVVAAFT
jgi:hypothetical protein